MAPPWQYGLASHAASATRFTGATVLSVRKGDLPCPKPGSAVPRVDSKAFKEHVEMANMKTGWTPSVAMTLLLAGIGCDSQVGTGYTGEVQFSLQGNVELDADSGLVPALAFEKSGNRTIDGPEALEVVDGEVSGVFPSKFRLDMTRSPPEAALSRLMGAVIGGTGSAAYGAIVMLPSNHAASIPRATVEEILGPPSFPATLPDGSPDPAWVPSPPQLVQKIFTNCSTDGRCRVRKTSCTQSDCTLFASAGTPTPPEASIMALESAGEVCGVGFPYCYGAKSSCSLAGCHEDFYQCDLTNLGPYDAANGSSVTRCALVEESGDASLTAILDLKSVATEYGILYSTVDVPDSLVGNVKRGYNLMALPFLTQDEWVAIRTCQDNATVQARQQYNAEHGTSYALNDLLPSDAAKEETKTLEGLWKACPSLPAGQVVDNRPITIKLGPPPFPM